MTLSFLLELLVVIEESIGSWDNFILFDTPEILELVDNCGLFVEVLHNFLSDHVIQSQDTIRDSGGLEDLDPTNFVGVVSVSSTASLDVNSFDINDSDCVSWYDTSLIQVEAELFLSSFLVFEILADGMSF